MIGRKIAILAALPVMVLAGCAKEGTPYVKYDKAKRAKIVTPKKGVKGPVKIVKVGVQLPLPGQLKKLPKKRKSKAPVKKLDPKKVIANANRLSRVTPRPDDFINANSVRPYSEGALYQVWAAPKFVTSVDLQKGEKLLSISMGDTARWKSTVTESGTGENWRTHIGISPIVSGIATNAMIATNRRTYHLELKSDDETYLSRVSWVYPEDNLLVLKRKNSEARADRNRKIAEGLNLANMKFRYRLTGDAPWRPEQVFDDGKHVYIRFPEGMKRGVAPPLFVVGHKGRSTLVNYHVRDNYYVVHQLFPEAILKYGADKVRITRKDVRYK